jgi:hypothetical protein
LHLLIDRSSGILDVAFVVDVFSRRVSVSNTVRTVHATLVTSH